MKCLGLFAAYASLPDNGIIHDYICYKCASFLILFQSSNCLSHIIARCFSSLKRWHTSCQWHSRRGEPLFPNNQFNSICYGQDKINRTPRWPVQLSIATNVQMDKRNWPIKQIMASDSFHSWIQSLTKHGFEMARKEVRANIYAHRVRARQYCHLYCQFLFISVCLCGIECVFSKHCLPFRAEVLFLHSILLSFCLLKAHQSFC